MSSGSTCHLGPLRERSKRRKKHVPFEPFGFFVLEKPMTRDAPYRLGCSISMSCRNFWQAFKEAKEVLKHAQLDGSLGELSKQLPELVPETVQSCLDHPSAPFTSKYEQVVLDQSTRIPPMVFSGVSDVIKR